MVKTITQKLLVMCTLLCALVISNAYKNDSIIELINPKKFQPLKHFEQLVHLNYSIFSEPYYINIQDECALNKIAFQKCVQSGYMDAHTVNYLNFSYQKPSLLYISSYMATRIKYFGTSSKGLPKQINFVYKHSKLWTSPVLDVAQKSFQENPSMNVRNIYSTDDNFSVVNALAGCNNTAFIALDTRIRDLERSLRSAGVTKISVGKEILLERKLGFYFKGWVPLFIQTRIRSVENSGILGWWNKIAAGQISMKISNKNNSRTSFMHRDEKSRHLIEVVFALMKGSDWFCLFVDRNIVFQSHKCVFVSMKTK